MIMNDLETNSGVTSWSSFGDDKKIEPRTLQHRKRRVELGLKPKQRVRRRLCRNDGFYGLANRF
jgi:hypothetical protein